MSNHPLTRPLQLCSGVVLLLAVFLAMVIGLDRGQLPPQVMAKAVPAALCLLAGVAACAIILALSGLLEPRAEDPAVRKVLGEIRDQLSRLPLSLPVSGTLSIPINGQAITPSPVDAARIVQVLDEIRDISLMNESQRQHRLESLMSLRRQSAAAAIDLMIQESRWTDANATLQQALTVFGQGAELDAIGTKLAESAAAAERNALADLQRNVTDLLAREYWEQAVAHADAVQTQFPDSDTIRQFAQKLRADRATYIELTANQLYDQIKQGIEQRSWRQAMKMAQRLLAKCPGHPRAKTVEAQIAILGENADIEQRNAMEIRIREFAKANRFGEAIEVAEELVNAYPLSKQAQIANQLITRLRERLAEEPAQTV